MTTSPADLPFVKCQGMLPVQHRAGTCIQGRQDKRDLQWPAGSPDDHRSGGEAGAPAAAPAAEGQPDPVDSSRHRHESSPLDADDRGPAAPAVVWVSEIGSRPPAADLNDGLCGHRPGSAPASLITGGEQPGQQPVESSAKPKPRPRRQPRSASGPVAAPEPPVVSADAADLTCQQECVICMDQPKSVLLAPCGHIVACLRCAEEHYGVDGCLAIAGNMSCPPCRQLIRATVKAIFT